MKVSRVLLIGVLLVFLTGLFVPAAMAFAEFCCPQEALAGGYTVDSSGNVLFNGQVLLIARNGVKAVAVSGDAETFSVTFQYRTWQGIRQYHAIYAYNGGKPFAWNASKSTSIARPNPSPASREV